MSSDPEIGVRGSMRRYRPRACFSLPLPLGEAWGEGNLTA
jgi:hypothetical protein